MSRLNILCVDGDDDLRTTTLSALTANGHVARGAASGAALDRALTAFDPDLLLLDINLPGEDGLSIARRMRRARPEIGIIMLAARNQVDDLTLGYGSGADLFLTRPLSIAEISAAVNALSRRLKPNGGTASQLRLNPITLQLHGTMDCVDVSRRECQLLQGFTESAERTLSTDQINGLVGKTADEYSKSTLEVQIVRLRKKLEQATGALPTIKAIRGLGYQLCVPIQIHTPLS